MNRRDFLKNSAAVAAVLPSFNILHAKDGVIGPDDDQINVAVIGYGAEGEIHSQLHLFVLLLCGGGVDGGNATDSKGIDQMDG